MTLLGLSFENTAETWPAVPLLVIEVTALEGLVPLLVYVGGTDNKLLLLLLPEVVVIGVVVVVVVVVVVLETAGVGLCCSRGVGEGDGRCGGVGGCWSVGGRCWAVCWSFGGGVGGGDEFLKVGDDLGAGGTSDD